MNTQTNTSKPVLGKIENSTVVLFECPGCEEGHQIDTARWEFNGDYVKPTFSPSYLTWLDANPDALPELRKGRYVTGWRCHSFIKDGMIEYLSDCTHKLAGQTVALPEWEQSDA